MTKPERAPQALFDDEFWRTAINPAAAFRDDGQAEFRRGLIDGNEDDLAWSRLLIYDVSDQAIWQIVVRLIELALGMPRAEFVECLVLFLSNEQSLSRLRATLSSLSDEQILATSRHADALFAVLQDADAYEGKAINSFRELMVQAIQDRSLHQGD